MNGVNYWRQQPAWFISSAGSDEATGADSGHPIKTNAELCRRWGMIYGHVKIDQPTTVSWLNAPSASDIFMFDVSFGEAGLLTFSGTPTVAASGTFTAVTAINRGTQTMQSVTDTGLAGGWAPYIGTHMIRIVGGARAGSTSWVAKDLGSFTARTSRWARPSASFTPTVASMAPQVGDAYEILLPTQVTGGDLRIRAYNDTLFPETTKVVTVNDVFVHASTINTQLIGGGTGCLKFGNARFDAVRMGGILVILQGCNLYPGASPPSDAGMRVFGGAQLYKFASMHRGNSGYVAPGAVEVDDMDTLYQSCNAKNVEGLLATGTCAMFDGTGANSITVNDSATVRSSPLFDGSDLLWGTANSNRGVQIVSGGLLDYITKPTINSGLGLTRELLIAGTDLLWSDAPVSDMAHRAACVERT